jgi:selenide,water dikinase
LLTKPLGTGIITTGIKFGKTPQAVQEEAIAWMLRLNDLGALLDQYSIHAATDITGYGLLGHAWEMAKASQVSLHIDAEKVPLMVGTESLVAEKMLPGGIEANRRFLGAGVVWGQTSQLLQQILLDPQTSGGLLLSVSPNDADEICGMADRQSFSAWQIGKVSSREEVSILVH